MIGKRSLVQASAALLLPIPVIAAPPLSPMERLSEDVAMNLGVRREQPVAVKPKFLPDVVLKSGLSRVADEKTREAIAATLVSENHDDLVSRISSILRDHCRASDLRFVGIVPRDSMSFRLDGDHDLTLNVFFRAEINGPFHGPDFVTPHLPSGEEIKDALRSRGVRVHPDMTQPVMEIDGRIVEAKTRRMGTEDAGETAGEIADYFKDRIGNFALFQIHKYTVETHTGIYYSRMIRYAAW